MKTTINIPVTVSYETSVKMKGKIFASLLERELMEPEISAELQSVVEKAKVNAIRRVNDLV